MTKERAEELAEALRKRFDAQVDAEEIEGRPGRFRFGVVSPQFEKMPHLQRQDAAWVVVDEVLSPEESLDITLVLTYAPSELMVAD